MGKDKFSLTKQRSEIRYKKSEKFDEKFKKMYINAELGVMELRKDEEIKEFLKTKFIENIHATDIIFNNISVGKGYYIIKEQTDELVKLKIKLTINRNSLPFKVNDKAKITCDVMEDFKLQLISIK